MCAHYDSISPGARDNASGVATVLLAMEYFQQLAPYPDTELRFIAFTGEESGHEGSLMYVENLTPDEKQRSLATFNVDILLVTRRIHRRPFPAIHWACARRTATYPARRPAPP